MEETYHCSVRNKDLTINGSRDCKFYNNGYCNSLKNDCFVESALSDLEEFALEPGSLITHDSVLTSLRHLRMQDGR